MKIIYRGKAYIIPTAEWKDLQAECAGKVPMVRAARFAVLRDNGFIAEEAVVLSNADFKYLAVKKMIRARRAVFDTMMINLTNKGYTEKEALVMVSNKLRTNYEKDYPLMLGMGKHATRGKGPFDLVDSFSPKVNKRRAPTY